MSESNERTEEAPMLAIGRKHFGDNPPQGFYLASMELLALHDASVQKMRGLLELAVPFLRDAGEAFEDDGSNEPLELAREIESCLDAAPLAAPAESAAETDDE